MFGTSMREVYVCRHTRDGICALVLDCNSVREDPTSCKKMTQSRLKTVDDGCVVPTCNQTAEEHKSWSRSHVMSENVLIGQILPAKNIQSFSCATSVNKDQKHIICRCWQNQLRMRPKQQVTLWATPLCSSRSDALTVFIMKARVTFSEFELGRNTQIQKAKEKLHF